MLIAQITDLHVRRREDLAYQAVDTAAHLERCVAHLNSLDPAPDLVLVTGDLVHDGGPAEYRVLREMIDAIAHPVFLIPGNHDDRAVLRATFDHHRYLAVGGDHVQYRIDDWPLRLIGLDSTIAGEHGGALCARRLEWLDAALSAAPVRETLLFMHHPPFRTGLGFMDASGLDAASAAAFGALLERHPEVIRLVCGHIHRAIHTTWHGVSTSVAPSTAHAVALDLASASKLTVSLEPPACHLHLWQGGRDVLTHLSYIDPGEVVYVLEGSSS